MDREKSWPVANRRSPTLEGFRIMFRQPALGLAEAAWHWSFGAAAAAWLAFGFTEYLDSLPVGPRELVLLRTNRLPLMARALADIAQGSGPRLAECAVLLACSLAVAWVALASWGRTATAGALLAHFRAPSPDRVRQRVWASSGFRPLVGLNFLRVAATAAAVVVSLVPWFSPAIRSAARDGSLAGTWLGVIFVIFAAWVSWYLLNWIFSMAALFALAESRNTWDAIAATVEFCSRRTASVLAVNAWFGFAHLGSLFFAASVMAFSLGFLSVLPIGYGLVGALLVLLVYFLLVDFLRVGRLAAYVVLLEEADPGPPFAGDPVQPGPGYSGRGHPVDPDELILSDVPAAAPQL
jgi:hypothetical protein